MGWQACVLLAAQCGAALAAPRRMEQQGATSRPSPLPVSKGNGETGPCQHWPSCKPTISTQCLSCTLLLVQIAKQKQTSTSFSFLSPSVGSLVGSMLVNSGYTSYYLLGLKSQSKSKCQHHFHSSAL